MISKSKNWQSPDEWKLVEISPDEEIESLVYIENVTNNYFLAISDNGNGEFVKRQQEYANLILFQITLKDGN